MTSVTVANGMITLSMVAIFTLSVYTVYHSHLRSVTITTEKYIVLI